MERAMVVLQGRALASEPRVAGGLRDDGIAFVTRFCVRAALADRYAVHVVGAGHHAELWVPAEELELLNGAIVGPIEIVSRLAAGAGG